VGALRRGTIGVHFGNLLVTLLCVNGWTYLSKDVRGARGLPIRSTARDEGFGLLDQPRGTRELMSRTPVTDHNRGH
jgi:hypothetical protein